MDGGHDCAARIDLHLPKLRLSPGFQLSITFRSRMWQGVRMLSRFRSPMMKFEYQVKPFSAGQPPDQIEKVLNQSGESGWEVVATFVKQDSTLCFVLKKTTGLKLAAE